MLASSSSQLPNKIGIQISDLNLSREKIDINLIDNLIDQYNAHHLLIIKKQNLTEEQLIRVAQLFGEPAQALVPTFRLNEYPVITRHTNKKDGNNIPTGVMAPEYVFHSDSYFTVNPSKATIFYGIKAPRIGGETHFINMCDVYDSLSEATKEFIADKSITYKNAYLNQPPVTHPMVRVHPITKAKALFANKHRALGIPGLDDHEALKLIENLYDHATNPEFIYKHKWEDGDLLIWNNATTMHCATEIKDTEERLLYRILTKGDLPVT